VRRRGRTGRKGMRQKREGNEEEENKGGVRRKGRLDVGDREKR